MPASLEASYGTICSHISCSLKKISLQLNQTLSGQNKFKLKNIIKMNGHQEPTKKIGKLKIMGDPYQSVLFFQGYKYKLFSSFFDEIIIFYNYKILY